MKKLLYVSILISLGMSNMHAQNGDFLFLIEQAIKAPSGHNTQPWLFKIKDNSIEVHPNFKKSLPVVDPDNRELFISLGCAVENLCIAASAKGYKSAIRIGNDSIITIDLEKDEQETYNPLFEQIDIRQSNRSVYNGRKIASDTLGVLSDISLKAGLNIHFYEKGTAEFYSISNLVVKGNIMQMQDKEFVNELKSWMRFNKKHQDKTNDGLSYAVFGAPNLPMFIVKPIMSGYLNSKKQNKGDIKKMESSSHFVLFTVQENALGQWINLGRVLERFLLKSTELGIVHAYLNQPNEISELSIEMADVLQLAKEYPAILLRIGYGEKQPYSKRKDLKDVFMTN